VRKIFFYKFTRPKCKVKGLKMGQNEPTSTKAHPLKVHYDLVVDEP